MSISNQKITGSANLTNATQIRYSVYVASGSNSTISNLGIQLETGSTETTFEQYSGGTVSPNPDYPQPINVVSGRQDINVCGKNLYNSSFRRSNNTIYSARGTTTEENGVFTITATGTNPNMWIWEIVEEGQQYIDDAGQLFEFTSDIYSVLITNELFTNNYITYYDENKVSLGYINKSSNTFSFSKSNKTGAKYFSLRFGYSSAVEGTSYDLSIELEKGDTATSYEAYKGQTYEINLGKNLYNSEIELGTINTSTGLNENATNCVRSKDYIAVQPKTTYTISNNKNYQEVIYFYGSDKSLKRVVSGSAGNYTFTTGSNEYYIRNRTSQGSNQNDTSVLFQLEKGNIATSYSAYKIPIKFCSNGTYEDNIYKSADKWYVERQIGSKTFDGTENDWSVSNTGTANYSYRYTFDGQMIETNNPISNNYTYNNINAGNTFQGFMLLNSSSTQLQMRVRYGTEDTITNYKNWLSTHPTEVQYVLATPTITEITDSELITQLEALKSATSYDDQTNISQDSGDTKFVLTFEAIKSLKNILN